MQLHVRYQRLWNAHVIPRHGPPVRRPAARRRSCGALKRIEAEGVDDPRNDEANHQRRKKIARSAEPYQLVRFVPVVVLIRHRRPPASTLMPLAVVYRYVLTHRRRSRRQRRRDG